MILIFSPFEGVRKTHAWIIECMTLHMNPHIPISKLGQNSQAIVRLYSHSYTKPKNSISPLPHSAPKSSHNNANTSERPLDPLPNQTQHTIQCKRIPSDLKLLFQPMSYNDLPLIKILLLNPHDDGSMRMSHFLDMHAIFPEADVI